MVRDQVGPQIRLLARDRRESLGSSRARSWRDFSIAVTVLAALLLAVAFVYGEFVETSIEVLDEWLPRVTPAAFAGGGVALLAAVVLAFAHRSLAEKDRATIRAKHSTLLIAAYHGAREVLEQRGRRAAVHGGGRPGSGVAAGLPGRAASQQPAGAGAEIDPRQVEFIAAEWMRRLGAVDATVTQYRGDGGIDVYSSGSIAQVKHLSSTIGPAAIRELAGVAQLDGRVALFFSTSGYAKGAVEFAHRSGIALFRIRLDTGELVAENGYAKGIRAQGLR